MHTTGVNWEAVASISASVATLIALAIWPTLRTVKKSMRAALDDAVEGRLLPHFKEISEKLDLIEQRLTRIEHRLNDHERRITRIEGIEEGKRAATRQQLAGQVPPIVDIDDDSPRPK